MALVIETRSSHGSVSRTHLRAGAICVVVRPGDTFRLYDEDTGKAPAKAVVKQLDNSILVDNLAYSYLFTLILLYHVLKGK